MGFAPGSLWEERCHLPSAVCHLMDFKLCYPWGDDSTVRRLRFAVQGGFNPRSPWGERRLAFLAIFAGGKVSIHAPRGGSDCDRLYLRPCSAFQSTLPVGGATGYALAGVVVAAVEFQSTLPVGGATRRLCVQLGDIEQFQSTLPVGGATQSPGRPRRNRSVSIHAPRGGSDSHQWWCCCSIESFNPRSPWGERP